MPLFVLFFIFEPLFGNFKSAKWASPSGQAALRYADGLHILPIYNLK
jgi:hypothetical protein